MAHSLDCTVVYIWTGRLNHYTLTGAVLQGLTDAECSTYFSRGRALLVFSFIQTAGYGLNGVLMSWIERRAHRRVVQLAAGTPSVVHACRANIQIAVMVCMWVKKSCRSSHDQRRVVFWLELD